ncbi:MAG: alkyl hydroperoxide reductase, partial [Sinobacteraceae bacterium]|nr:alkyl hydroperoxide reductase [Nevskiaceae bacterium]
MTTLDTIRDAIPDYARDLKLNLGSVLATTGAPGLTDKQIWAVALASAIASRNPSFTREIESLAAAHLDSTYINGARAAASIMGM